MVEEVKANKYYTNYTNEELLAIAQYCNEPIAVELYRRFVDYVEEMDGLTDDNETLEAEKETIRIDYEQATDEIVELLTKLDAKDIDLEQLLLDVENLETELNETQIEVQQVLKDHEKANANHKLDLGRLSAINADLESNFEDNQRKLDKANAEIKKLKR